MKEAYKLPLAEFSFIINHIVNIFKEDTPLQRDFTLTDPKGDSVTFGFIPKLDDISLGEFIDLDNYIGDWQQIHKAMAVLYRPITFRKGDLYLIEDYEGSDKYAEIMKDAPVGVALGAVVFFYRLGKKLSSYMMHYLQNQVEELKQSQPQNKDLERSGDGIKVFMDLHKEMSEGFQKLPSFHYNNA